MASKSLAIFPLHFPSLLHCPNVPIFWWFPMSRGFPLPNRSLRGRCQPGASWWLCQGNWPKLGILNWPLICSCVVDGMRNAKPAANASPMRDGPADGMCWLATGWHVPSSQIVAHGAYALAEDAPSTVRRNFFVWRDKFNWQKNTI
jgi:hypothetical protein